MNDFNPSGFLFPLARLCETSTAIVEDAMEKLALIYSKGDDAQLSSGRHSDGRAEGSLAHLDASLRSSIRWRNIKQVKETVVDSGYASAEEDEPDDDGRDEPLSETLQTVRHDSFERELTIRWLTGFISRSSSWMLPNDQELLDDELEEREVLIEKAASLLSSCANINEVDDEALSRKFKFPLGPADAGTNICVELNDLQATEDHSSVGLQSWPSSICFARMTSENPAGFNIVSGRTRRVLELGAGTGMLSIVTAKICRALSGGKPFGFPQIVATDYHPDVLLNLKRNVESNFASDTHLPVDVYPLDWQHPSWEHPFDAPYDLILAADVIYEPEHAGWIKDCVSRLLKRPSPSYPEGGAFWMFIALRNIGRREGLAAKVFDVFPTLDTELVKSSDELSLKAVQVRDLERSEGIGRRDESGYRLFKIRWA